MRSHLYSSLGAVKLGLDILLKDEKMAVDRIMGHGGLFKTKGVAQRYLAAAVHAPVSVLETAGEGGPWGMALLALYMIDKKEEGRLLRTSLTPGSSPAWRAIQSSRMLMISRDLSSSPPVTATTSVS